GPLPSETVRGFFLPSPPRGEGRRMSRLQSRTMAGCGVDLHRTLLPQGAAMTAPAANPQVNLTTSQGSITVELYPDQAPITVKNFLDYVNAGFFDNTIFHRVIPNFMVQCGGFEPGMKQKRTNAPIKNESANGLTNDRGTLAMARTNEPHSASSQFFINLV